MLHLEGPLANRMLLLMVLRAAGERVPVGGLDAGSAVCAAAKVRSLRPSCASGDATGKRSDPTQVRGALARVWELDSAG